MSRHGRMKLLESTLLLVKSLLDGANPTPKRVDALLLELKQRRRPIVPRMEAESMLDEQDRDLGRSVHSPRAHAEWLNADDPENLQAAINNIGEAQQRHATQARERLTDKIAENEAKGLHRHAPAIEEDSAVVTPGTTTDSQPTPDIPEASPLLAVAPPPTVSPGESPGDEAAAIDVAKAGVRKVYAVAESLERRVLQKMPKLASGGRTLKSLEDAAEVLIAELQPNHQDAIRQVCEEHALATWVVLLGAIARMADLQELNAGEFEDAWLNRQSLRGGTAPTAKEERCQMCGGILPPDPIRKNRTACCNRHGSGQVAHSDGCALATLQMVAGKWTRTG